MTSKAKHPMITPTTVAIETGSAKIKSNPETVYAVAVSPRRKSGLGSSIKKILQILLPQKIMLTQTNMHFMDNPKISLFSILYKYSPLTWSITEYLSFPFGF